MTSGSSNDGPGAQRAHPASAVVTGAAVGIGRGIAECLIADGLTVVGLDRDAAALDQTAAELGAAFVPSAGDIAVWADHERAADVAEEHGRLVGWVNNAGIDWVASAHEADQGHIDAGLDVLLNGPMYGGAVAARRMVSGGGGSIVNIASIQGVRTFPRYYVYGSAKAGLLQATRSIAVDYAPYGIRCNAILPGTIETPMTHTTLPPELDVAEALRREGELSPMGRVGQPREIGEVAAFLISERASYLTGAEIPVDGGATARCFRYPDIEL